MDNKQTNKANNDELSIKEIIQIIQDWWKYLWSKWLFILICGLVGGGLGVVYSLFKAPKYSAHLSFALVEDAGSMSGLADFASSMGLSALFGGNSGAFSGDNLLEIVTSRYIVEETLLTPVIFKGENKTLADAFIQYSGIRKKWNKNKKVPELKTLSYPIGQPRETFTRVQDSVLFKMFQAVSNPRYLQIARVNKKISIVTVDFTSYNEQFSKLFIENLIEQTYNFYSKTRTAQIRINVEMMQQKADSVKTLYEDALYKSAGIPQINVNPAIRFANVPRIKQEANAQLFSTVYVEVLKNLETLKLDLARKTPLVQIIDTPRYPLYKSRFGKFKGIVFGGFIGGILALGYLISKKYLNNLL